MGSWMRVLLGEVISFPYSIKRCQQPNQGYLRLAWIFLLCELLNDRTLITPQPENEQAAIDHAEDIKTTNSADEPASGDMSKLVETDNDSPLKPPPPTSAKEAKPVRKTIEVQKAVQEVEEQSDSEIVESRQVVKTVKGASSRSRSKPISKTNTNSDVTETSSKPAEDEFSTLLAVYSNPKVSQKHHFFDVYMSQMRQDEGVKSLHMLDNKMKK